MLSKIITKYTFESNFKKYFYNFQYLNNKNFQVLKLLKTFSKIIIKRALKMIRNIF